MIALERPKRSINGASKPNPKILTPNKPLESPFVQSKTKQPISKETQKHQLSEYSKNILSQLKDATDQPLTTSTFRDFAFTFVRSHPILSNSNNLKVIYLPKILDTLYSYEFNTDTSYRRTTFYQAFRKLLHKNQLSFELQQLLVSMLEKYMKSIPNASGVMHGFEQFDELESLPPTIQKHSKPQPINSIKQPSPQTQEHFETVSTSNPQVTQLLQNIKEPYNGEIIDTSSYDTRDFSEYLLNSTKEEKKEIGSFGKLLCYSLKDPHNPINNEFQDTTFEEKIGSVIQEVASMVKPQGLNIIQRKLRKFIFLTNKDKKKEKQKLVIEQKLETKDLKSLQTLIEQRNLEKSINISDLFSYLFAHNIIQDDNVIRYLISQSDFINKSLNRSGKQVHFINQVGYLMGELRNPKTKIQFIHGLNNYIFSKIQGDIAFDEEVQEQDWAIDESDTEY